jgi:DNA replicative helicase MCM subunit Mcm2 (Cdc46/Mcm family)
MDMEDSDPSALGDSDSPVFEKFNPLLHGAVAGAAASGGSGSGSEKRPELLCQAFLKRYMHYAKRIVHPQLCDEARAYIAGAYSELRCSALLLIQSTVCYCCMLSVV